MGRLPRSPKIAGVPIRFRTAKDLSAAAIDIVTGRHVSLQMAQQRWDTCTTCEHFTGTRCKLCGCFMKKKVALPSSKCPDGRWG
jgi:hypothetical protein